jgi:hypothetical protein
LNALTKNRHSFFYNVAVKYPNRPRFWRTLWALEMDRETVTPARINHIRIASVFAEAVLTVWLRSLRRDIPQIDFWPVEERVLVGAQNNCPWTEGVRLVGGRGNVWSEEVLNAYLKAEQQVWYAARRARILAYREKMGIVVKVMKPRRTSEELKKSGKTAGGEWRKSKEAQDRHYDKTLERTGKKRSTTYVRRTKSELEGVERYSNGRPKMPQAAAELDAERRRVKAGSKRRNAPTRSKAELEKAGQYPNGRWKPSADYVPKPLSDSQKERAHQARRKRMGAKRTYKKRK